jgi:hypothetical protein
MMEISKDSWHYRVQRWCDFTVPNNLCKYFWMTVLAVIGTPAFFLAVGFFVVAGAVLALLPFWWTFAESALVLVVIIGSAEIIGLSWLLGQIIQERHEQEIYFGKRERPVPSLSAAWVRAKKQKICPILKFN